MLLKRQWNAAHFCQAKLENDKMVLVFLALIIPVTFGVI